jgi:hypothetical protein
MGWKFWKKEEEVVEFAPREFFVTNPQQVKELCTMWTAVSSLAKDTGREYLANFWCRANEICQFPEKMELFDPEFMGHFIRFTEDKSEFNIFK